MIGGFLAFGRALYCRTEGGNLMKRPIDRKRESAGMFEIDGPPGERIVGVVVIGNRMAIVGAKGVYEAQMADGVDPERIDHNLPQAIQRQVMPYGCETPFIARTIMTAKELFNPAQLAIELDVPKGLSLAYDAAHEFAAMADIATTIKQYEERAAAELAQAKANNSLTLRRCQIYDL